jgi:DNA-binding MarR family transcriptional regulator
LNRARCQPTPGTPHRQSFAGPPAPFPALARPPAIESTGRAQALAGKQAILDMSAKGRRARVHTMKKAKRREAQSDALDDLHAGVQEHNVGYHLIELYDIYVRFLRSRTHSKMMNLNLTQWRTLTYIRFNPDRTQRALSTAVGIDPSSMTPIVDFFEDKGLVRRHKSTTNRSAYELRMTTAGSKAYRLIEREMGRSEEMFAQILGSGDRNKLLTLLQTLHDKLARELSPDAS